MQNDPEQQSRISRGLRQQFFVIDLPETKTSYLFKISGSTGKLYTISISKAGGHAKCDCPDFKTRARLSGVWCKHLCFVVLRVLRQPLSMIKKKLSHEVVANIRLDRSLTNQKYITEYKRRQADKSTAPPPLPPPLSEQDKKKDCIICYANFVSDDKYIQCAVCRNIVHGVCMNKWLEFNHRSCVFCRSEMHNITMVIPTGAASKSSSDPYYQFKAR